jgi:hypothetical protein
VPPARRKEKEKRIGFTSIQMVHTHTKKNTKDKKINGVHEWLGHRVRFCCV